MKPAAHPEVDCRVVVPGPQVEQGALVVPLATAVSAPLGDDVLVLDLASGSYYGLGSVGGFVWARLDGKRTLAELAASVREEFADAEGVEADLGRFAGELVAFGLAEERRG